MLSFTCKDNAERIALLQEANAAFDRCTNLWGRMVVASNHVGWMEILFIAAVFWPRKVRFTFDHSGDREMPLIIEVKRPDGEVVYRESQ